MCVYVFFWFLDKNAVVYWKLSQHLWQRSAHFYQPYYEIGGHFCTAMLRLISGKHKIGFSFVWFLFYGPSTHFRSFRARSITLTTLLLGNLVGSLPVLSAHSFPSNWQLLFLNQRKRENGRRIFYHDQVSTKEFSGHGDRTRGALACQVDTLPIELPRPVLLVRQSVYVGGGRGPGWWKSEVSGAYM